MFDILQKIKFNKLKNNADASFSEYLKIQLDRSKSKYNVKNELEEKRKKYLVELLSRNVDLKQTRNALVVGCRNSYELDLLEKKGLKKIIGIDLFSYDKRIKTMDMHNLKFKENCFDLIYCSHALEHAYDYNKVISEVVRVSQDSGIIAIEVPVNYETRGSDIHDFKSSDNLLNIFSQFTKVDKVYFAEDLKKDKINNFSGTDISRTIFKIKK